MSGLILRIRLFHIADDGLPTVVHMNMLNSNKLLPAVTQASKDFHLHRKCLHQTRGKLTLERTCVPA